MTSTRVVVLPPAPALLPAYGGILDPVPELRRACRSAVAWLTDGAGDDGDVAVLADPPDEAARRRGVEIPLGVRVARALLAKAPLRHVEAPAPADRRILVLANGSACRSEKAPGHLDPRAFAYDERIETALRVADNATLATLEPGLLAAGIPQLRRLGEAGLAVREADLRYAGDPYGVRYWVATWECDDRTPANPPTA